MIFLDFCVKNGGIILLLGWVRENMVYRVNDILNLEIM